MTNRLRILLQLRADGMADKDYAHIHVEQNDFGTWKAYNRADRTVGRLG